MTNKQILTHLVMSIVLVFAVISLQKPLYSLLTPRFTFVDENGKTTNYYEFFGRSIAIKQQ